MAVLIDPDMTLSNDGTVGSRGFLISDQDSNGTATTWSAEHPAPVSLLNKSNAIMVKLNRNVALSATLAMLGLLLRSSG